jgi:hypothetical protein
VNKNREEKRILDSFGVYDVPDDYKILIQNAINSEEWDWFKDCDGCSLTWNYWPTKFSPPCLVHDYHWRTGRGGYWSDKIFLELMKIYSIPRWQRTFRFSLVRVGWFLYFKRKHKKNDNIRKLDTQTKTIINKWKI